MKVNSQEKKYSLDNEISRFTPKLKKEETTEFP